MTPSRSAPFPTVSKESQRGDLHSHKFAVDLFPNSNFSIFGPSCKTKNIYIFQNPVNSATDELPPTHHLWSICKIIKHAHHLTWREEANRISQMPSHEYTRLAEHLSAGGRARWSRQYVSLQWPWRAQHLHGCWCWKHRGNLSEGKCSPLQTEFLSPQEHTTHPTVQYQFPSRKTHHHRLS